MECKAVISCVNKAVNKLKLQCSRFHKTFLRWTEDLWLKIVFKPWWGLGHFNLGVLSYKPWSMLHQYMKLNLIFVLKICWPAGHLNISYGVCMRWHWISSNVWFHVICDEFMTWSRTASLQGSHGICGCQHMTRMPIRFDPKGQLPSSVNFCEILLVMQNSLIILGDWPTI